MASGRVREGSRLRCWNPATRVISYVYFAQPMHKGKGGLSLCVRRDVVHGRKSLDRRCDTGSSDKLGFRPSEAESGILK